MKPALLPVDPAREAEAACIARCRAGDARAIEALVRSHIGPVQRVIGRLLGNSPDVEDLVQTTLLRAIGSLDRFRGEASFKTWITRIAVNVVHHHLRAGKVRRHVTLEAVPESALPCRREDPDAQLDGHQLAQRLYELLDGISAKKRIALLLFAVEERPVEEVAALMGASQTATRSRVFFARRELRKRIAARPELRHLVAELFEGRGVRP